MNTKVVLFLCLILPGFSASAVTPLTSIELLGKNVFFDTISVPGNKQGCVSCHEPSRGGILPDSKINGTTVVAPGAAPHALGSAKTPTNTYATLVPPFVFSGGGPVPPPYIGGVFWDGRAEGCGAISTSCPKTPTPVENPKNYSETIFVSDIPLAHVPTTLGGSAQPGSPDDYTKYLGPVADQALNPFPNLVEQDIREKNVCNSVKTAKYKALYAQAYGQEIDCSPDPQKAVVDRAYHKSFKLIALALSAYQASSEINQFSSKRDIALRRELDGTDVDSTPGKFPLVGLTAQENLGHQLFYTTNFTGNAVGPRGANCVICHNSGKPTSDGTELDQVYSDFKYHNIGTPFNREIPGVAEGEKKGLATHVTILAPGDFKAPPLRNVGRGLDGTFVKAYAHNGWFKSLPSIVHFYNTRDALPTCESLSITNATEKEALAHNCWPKSEFAGQAGGIIGNLHLTADEEAALVAYMLTFSDQNPVTKP